MGYYTRIETKQLRIKEEFVNKVKQDIKICKENSADYLSSNMNEHPNFTVLREKIGISGDYVFWHIESMIINNDNSIYWDDEFKFYGETELLNYLKYKVTEGDLLCFGEDGTQWGFRFDGKGNMIKLKSSWVEE